MFDASARTDDVAAAAVLFRELRVVFGLPGDDAGDVTPRALLKELDLLNDDRFAELRATPGFRQMVGGGRGSERRALAAAARAGASGVAQGRGTDVARILATFAPVPSPAFRALFSRQVLTLHAFPSLLTDVDSNGRGLLQHAMHTTRTSASTPSCTRARAARAAPRG